MTKRRGPIRRKAGERKREQEERQKALEKSLRPRPEVAPSSDADSKPDEPGGGPRPPSGGGRRVFDPSGGRRAAPRPSGPPRGRGGPPRGGGGRGGAGPRGGGPPGRGRGPGPEAPTETEAPPKEAPATTAAKTAVKAAEQEEARELAKDKGIPLVHALRVVRDEVSLNEVLKALMRKERAQRLIERDGLDPGLAGQVASGHLNRERALLIQRIRQHRSHRIDRDAIKIAELDDHSVAIRAFDEQWVIGRVIEARTYEFDFRPDGPEGAAMPQITLQKHNIKAVCKPDALPAIRGAVTTDDQVHSAGLQGTADRGERVRPADELLMDLLDKQSIIRCVLRDGECYEGTIKSFGRWDLDLEVAPDAVLTIMFHSLHPACDWITG